MSGGNSDKKASPTIAAAAQPGVPNLSAQTTFPQAMPGQLEAIAAQLAAGFGGTPAEMMSHLDTVYAPSGSPGPIPAAPAAAAAAPAAAPSAQNALLELWRASQSPFGGHRDVTPWVSGG